MRTRFSCSTRAEHLNNVLSDGLQKKDFLKLVTKEKNSKLDGDLILTAEKSRRIKHGYKESNIRRL